MKKVIQNTKTKIKKYKDSIREEIRKLVLENNFLKEDFKSLKVDVEKN